WVLLSANLPGVRVRSRSQEKEPWLVGTNDTAVLLAQGTNLLEAEFNDPQLGFLEPRSTAIVASLVNTNRVRFDLDYGTVELSPPAAATVKAGEVTLTNRPVRRYQRPEQPETYTVSVAHFDPANLKFAV